MIPRLSIMFALLAAFAWGCTSPAFSAEKKAMKKVDVNALTGETQKMIGAGSSEVNLVWVIPAEFWEASLVQNEGLTEAQRSEVLDVLKEYLIVGVVRADISPLGSFRFHGEEAVFDNLGVSHVDAAGERRDVKLARRVDDDAQRIIDAMKPMIRAALGKMGDNFHFFICDNKARADGSKISPYAKGGVLITLDKIGKNQGGTDKIAFPLDSLHEPRECAKCQRKAHVSWTFCPWCGTKHAE